MAKMKKADVKPFKEMLLSLRSRLRGDVSTMADAALSGKHGSQIEGALERIENGVYGSCAECSGKIPKMRLKVMPYTPFCVKCQSEKESS